MPEILPYVKKRSYYEKPKIIRPIFQKDEIAKGQKSHKVKYMAENLSLVLGSLRSTRTNFLDIFSHLDNN